MARIHSGDLIVKTRETVVVVSVYGIMYNNTDLMTPFSVAVPKSFYYDSYLTLLHTDDFLYSPAMGRLNRTSDHDRLFQLGIRFRMLSKFKEYLDLLEER